MHFFEKIFVIMHYFCRDIRKNVLKSYVLGPKSTIKTYSI